ncbi:MAG: hypothetical protein Q4A13_04495 [Fretibacterium sp.]|uniref:hypothetical protein n=1 Tax=Fretibacterium sp. OH1220_COT-178 TaxID=2491047 RepID=UPI000F5FC84C|nr:hypothetical protein [Fretibacterium sp. OH1220_COT-178]MDO4786182.1 hypothetical protein [Fretibacterium sp.]RRD65890.1 hypothetical protein EII26_02180 [Fretibacterium sp. OH1220_COT-178]
MVSALFWLLQDLLTVLVWGMMQVPELFLLTVVYRLLSEEGDDRLWAIWTAFLGGLVWDLRWIGVPGFFTLGYVCVVMLVLWVWNALPVQGRTPLIVFALLEVSQLLPPLLPVLILGGDTGGVFFALQQLFALPGVLLCVYLYSKRLKEHHA